MQTNLKKITGRMVARIFSLPVGEHLVSGNFSEFLRRHDLDDVWNESLASPGTGLNCTAMTC